MVPMLLWLALAAPAGSAQVDLDDWRLEPEEWTHAVDGRTSLIVVNSWGDVRLRVGEGDRIKVSAMTQRHRDDPRELEVYIEEIPSGLRFETRFGDPLESSEQPEWSRRRVDLGVSIPDGISATIRTSGGDIEVLDSRVAANLEAETGDITFRGRGDLVAKSRSGAVWAQFLRADWRAPVEIETVTGAIRVELLEGASARAQVETRGPITTDYSMTIERETGGLLKRGEARIGRDGEPLRLESHSGSIRLVAVIVPESDDP
jgi:hypothetical protein